MTRTHLNMSTMTKYLSLALVVAVAACESPAGPVAGPGDANFAVANSVATTSITISPVSLSAGQAGQIVAQLWTAGHPLGGKPMDLYIDGTFVDSEHGSRKGTATFSVPALSAGSHTVKVEFTGDNNFFGSETTITISVS